MVTIRKAVTSDAEEFSKFMVMSAPYFLKLFGEKNRNSIATFIL